LSNTLSFRLENFEGNDFICFEYSHPELKLIHEDYILFLLSNEEVIKFPINSARYKVNDYKKGYRLPLYKEEVDFLSTYEVNSFRIHLKQENHNIDFNWSYSSDFPQKDFQYIIKSTFNNFSKVVSTLENYQPLIKLIDNHDRNQEHEDCYVYLMVDTTNNFHKIGISNNPQYREKTLQSEKPTIELVCHKVFPTRKISESIEKALHESFKNKRLRGEWFDLSEDDVSNIKKTLQ
jgi:mRNA-degrading endonuclease YafQ of YafQ-DinJ toxin-antitoxin module